MVVNLRNFLACFLGATVCLISYVSGAQTPPGVAIPTPSVPSTEPDPGSVVTPLLRGQRAPYSGTLLSPSTVAIVVTELTNAPKQCKIDTDAAVATCHAAATRDVAECRNAADVDARLLRSRVDALDRTNAANLAKIAELEQSQTNPLTWLGLGVGAGAIVTVLAVVIVH